MTATKPMTERERLALWDIGRWDGHYSIHWTPATWRKLQARGYVKADQEHVNITDEGRAALAKLPALRPMGA